MTTTTMTTKDAVTDIVNLVLEGKAMEAFETYYADDVVMQENEQAPTRGKDANREREEKFFGSIETFHGGEAPVVLAEGDQAVVNWIFDVTFKDGKRVRMDQVAVQQWQDGQIVSEKFYYDTAA